MSFHELSVVKVGGNKTAPVEGGWLALALAGVDHARSIGLERTSFTASRSASRQFQLRDRQGRVWRLRVSNHFAPHRTSAVNFQLVSFDGIWGRRELFAFIDTIADGTAIWFETKGTGHAHCLRTQKRINKRIDRRR